MDTAVRTGGTLILLCAMIDKFSELQQQLGTAAAEQSIKETTGVLKSCFRKSDLLARLGKAQFCALALDGAEPSAPILRQRVAARVSALNQLGESWRPLKLRMSVGFWGANDFRSFAQFLDSVEAELRQPEVSSAPAQYLGAAR
jgi:diguanylate cyclase (GGDEF)-like protein